MRGKKPTELEQIDAGLASFVDIEKAPLPKDVEERLGQMSIESLIEIDDLGQRLDTAVKVQRGFIWIMIKRKLGHGDFKKFVQEQGKKYMTVWSWMAYARAYQRSPDVAKFITGNAVPHLLYLSSDQVSAIEESILGIPAEQAKKVTRDFIEAEYIKIQEEKQRDSYKPPKHIPENIPQSELLDLATAASVALLKLAHYEIPPGDYPQCEQLQRELARAWDRALYNLVDPAHKTVPMWEDSRPSLADLEHDEDDDEGLGYDQD